MFNDLSSLQSYFATRRSGRPRDMVAPGPDEAQIASIVATACRTPDHGKLAPWRVVIVGTDQRDQLADIFVSAYRNEKPDAGRLEMESLVSMAHQAPSLLVVLSSPMLETKIPLWEQELSAGAFCMNLLHAIHIQGYVGGWLTGWPAFADEVRDHFGAAPERIAGFIFAGTNGGETKERPRPELGKVLSRWTVAT